MPSSLKKRYVLWDDRAEREVGIYVSREEARLALVLYKIGGKRAPARRGLGRDDRRDDYEIFEVDADYPGELSDPPRGAPRDLQGHAVGQDWYRQASSEIATRMRAGHDFDRALAGTARVYHLTAEQRATLRRMFESAEQHGASMSKGMYDDHASYRPVADMDATPAQQLKHFDETVAWLRSLPHGTKAHSDTVEKLIHRYEEQRALHAHILAENAPGRGQGGQRRHRHGRTVGGTAGGMPMDRQRMLIRDQQTMLAIREIKARMAAGATFSVAMAAVARATHLDADQQHDIHRIFDMRGRGRDLSLSKGSKVPMPNMDWLYGGPMPAGTIHERVARAMGWTVEETQRFDFQTLRTMVRRQDPALADEITRQIRTGEYIKGAPSGRRRGGASGGELKTKVTALGGGKGYGVRLLNGAGKVVMEGRADTKREVGALVAEMLRWYQKTGGTSKMAAASRERHARKGTSSGVTSSTREAAKPP